MGSKKSMADMMTGSMDDLASAMAELSNKVNDALRSTFRPEFLNRIDDIITFNSLSIADVEPIVDLQLADVTERLSARGIRLEVTPAARERLAIDGYDPVYGARPLKRLIQRQVVDRVATAMVTGEVLKGAVVSVDLDADGNYAVQIQNPAPELPSADAAALLEAADDILRGIE